MNCGKRHWRIMPRTIGVRAPVCIRCGSPNPRPLTEEEWTEVAAWAREWQRGNPFVLQALDARDPTWREKFR